MRPTVRDAANEWVQHARSMGLKPGTVKGRHDAMSPLVKKHGGQTVASLQHVHLDRLFANAQWSPATRNQRLGHYRNFFSWCRARGYMPLHHDPLFGWGYLKKPPTTKLRVPVQKWPALFNACETPMERVIVATGLYLFLRASEQRLLRIKHFDLQNNVVEIYRIKTETMDTMPIPSELRPYLVEYLTWYSSQVALEPEHYLLPARTKPISVGQRFKAGTGVLVPTKALDRIHLVVQAVLGRAGYETYKQGEHTLRRSGARAYFDELVHLGYDGALRDVQIMLGHELASTTEVYIGKTLDQEARNARLAGKPMFPSLQNANVVPIREVM